ncbi:MAG: hypothetical protein JNN15_02260 [Blastocatellia bacterium]|nr:hypothetical protein [Blastocatellia bacterium]
MFCPGCGKEEQQPSQFCRACGTDLRTVRLSLEKNDSLTASAVSAREEIGRAIASRLQQIEKTKDLKKVVEEVLPEVEKFLESPEERRLRRIRAGIITAAIGFGATILMLLNPGMDLPFKAGWPAGLLVFFIGVGVVINGKFFTVPSKEVPSRPENLFSQNFSDQKIKVNTQELQDSERFLTPPPSVTENTTRELPINRAKIPNKAME